MKTIDLAKWIITESTRNGDPKSLLKIQKIAYFLIVDYLGTYDEVLVDDFDFRVSRGTIESKSIDSLFWEFGANPIDKEYELSIDTLIEDFLRANFLKYFNAKPWQLAELQNNSRAIDFWKKANISEVSIPLWVVKEEAKK